MKKVFLTVLVVLFAVGTMMAMPAKAEGRMNAKGEKGERFEEMKEYRDEILEAHKDLIVGNRKKIEKIKLSMEKIGIEIKEEMMKDDPNWSNVKNLMVKEKKLRDQVWEIRTDERITILKSLTPEQREEMGRMLGGRGDRKPGRGGRSGMGR